MTNDEEARFAPFVSWIVCVQRKKFLAEKRQILTLLYKWANTEPSSPLLKSNSVELSKVSNCTSIGNYMRELLRCFAMICCSLETSL